MPGPKALAPATTPPRSGSGTATLVWIDGKLAILARWDGAPAVRRLTADIPRRHRSVGHVHRDPGVRHGGGGPVEDHLERVRAERERSFLAQVEAAIDPDDELLIIGPGVIHEHLAHRLLDHDRAHHRARHVRSEPADNLTEHQIVARLRLLVGAAPRRGRRPSRAHAARRRTASARGGSKPSSTRRRTTSRSSRPSRPPEPGPSISDWDLDSPPGS